jgi:D-alanyl-D-alanine endopeptidase (penicillin-binding protein 7)
MGCGPPPVKTHFSFRRKLRKLTRNLAAILPLLLAFNTIPAHAAAKPTSTQVKAPVRQAQVSPKAHKHRARPRRLHRIVPVVPSVGTRLGLHNTPDELRLMSNAALVIDQDTGETLALKNPDVALPIASLTKLMMALVVIDSGAPLDEVLEISNEDVDTERNTRSRLTVGTRLSRDELLLLALMSSENRAAMALSRNYPGGRAAFIARMNAKATELGMTSSHFADPAGLSNGSVSTARDLHHMVSAAYAQPLIRSYTTQQEAFVRAKGRTLKFINSNRLVRSASDDWNIELQKTGFTNEAGRCLIMQATVLSRRLAMIFLDSAGTLTRYADAARVRKHIEHELKALQPHAIPANARPVPPPPA